MLNSEQNSMKHTINIKSLSVNEAWKGRRYKTAKYKKYEHDLMLLLPNNVVVPEKIELRIKWGFSSSSSDIDNPLKPFIDVLQKKYNFNDKNIFKLIIEKEIVAKDFDFIRFEIVEYA